MCPESESLTGFLNRAARGDHAASERVWTAVYDELHRMAQREIRKEIPGQTLDTTGLVHEAFFKFAEPDMEWESRRHFFATACRAMRQILVDRARYRNAQKRATAKNNVTLDSKVAGAWERSGDLVALDEALQQLEEFNERLARVVECHFFGGLSFKETGETLGTSERTAERDWQRARSYLRRLMTAEAGEGG